jgi:hypothetical protein
MSEKGDNIIQNYMRRNSPIQNPNNAMHQLINFGLGGFLDHLEDIVNVTISKINIFNNIPENDTTEWESEITAGLLKLKGDEIKVYRREGESNTEYRNRLLGFLQNNSSIDSIIKIIASLLNIQEDSFTVTTTPAEEYLDFGDVVTNMLDKTSTDILASLIIKRENNVSTITIELPAGSDVQLIYETVSKILFVGVRLVVTNGVDTVQEGI